MRETRIKKILDILTDDMQYHTSIEIAKKLNCSSRTVRDEIKEFNTIINDYGAVIIIVSHKGCIFKITDSEKFEFFLKDKWCNYAFTTDSYNDPKLRELYILKCLVFSYNYIKVDDICSQLFISRSQFSKDIQSVKKILIEYELELENKPYKGLRLVGQELNKRLLIADYLYKNSTFDSEFLDLSNEENKDTLDKIKQIVLDSFFDYKYNITDLTLKNLVIHLFIAIKRMQTNNQMTVSTSDLTAIQEKYEYKIATEITERLAKLFNIHIPEMEIAYTAMHLLGKKASNVLGSESIPVEVETLVESMLQVIKDNMSIDLTKDIDLRISLGLHLVPLIERIKYRLKLSNPILKEIKQDVIGFYAAIIATNVLNERYGLTVSEDEIGYIALHISVAIARINKNINKKDILVICGSGIGTANMMKYKLIREFEPHINKIDTCDYISSHNIDFLNYDLILTSIPLNRTSSTPILNVNLFLNDKDIVNIKSYIENDFDNNKIQSLFSRELFFGMANYYTYDSLLKFMAGEINERIALNGDLYTSMQKREKLASTILENGIAIPHPMVSLTKRTFITVAIPQKPIRSGDKTVRIALLLNIKDNEESKTIEDFYRKLGDFINDESKISKVLKNPSYDNFIKIFIGQEKE